MATTYGEQLFKQLLNKSTHSNSGFNLLCIVVVMLGAGIFFLVKYIFKGVAKMLEDKEEKELQKQLHSKAVIKFIKLLEGTNYTIHFNILRSHTNKSTYELTQNVNFVAYDSEKKSIEIINMLINQVLYDTLTISNSKDRDMAGTIVTKNAEIYQIQEDLEEIVGRGINFKNI